MTIRDPFLTPELLAALDARPLVHHNHSADVRAAIVGARRANPAAAALYQLAAGEKAARDTYLALKASSALAEPPGEALRAAFARWEEAWQRLTTARADQEPSDG